MQSRLLSLLLLLHNITLLDVVVLIVIVVIIIMIINLKPIYMYHYYHDPSWLLSIIIYIYIYTSLLILTIVVLNRMVTWGSPTEETSFFHHWKQKCLPPIKMVIWGILIWFICMCFIVYTHIIRYTYTSEIYLHLDGCSHYYNRLVGGWPTPLKNMSSSVGMMNFPIYGKSKNMFQSPPISLW